MKILYLTSGYDSELAKWIERGGDTVRVMTTPVRVEDTWDGPIDWIVSYGYRHKVPGTAIRAVNYGAVNLHIGYLPWSLVEGTPKGVTIHLMDEGIDTGRIIAQEKIDVDYDHDTLRTTYDRLIVTVERLFREWWPTIRTGQFMAMPQQGDGTWHTTTDRQKVEHLLTEGWETPIRLLDDYAGDAELSALCVQRERDEIADIAH